MSEYKHIKIFTDGGSRGNPGPAASGIVILTPEDEIIEQFGEYLGTTTNNQAEYRAVRFAFEAAKKYKPEKIEFFLDSELVVKQLTGVYRMKNVDLKPIFNDILAYAAKYDTSFTHVYRENNKLADRQVNIAIDRALGLSK